MKNQKKYLPLLSFLLLPYAALSAPLTINESAATSLNYGLPVSLDLAKKIIVGAELEAKKKNINVAISIVDSAGNLVMFSKADNTHLASTDVSQGKAITAVGFRRSTKLLQDAVNSGKATHLTTIAGIVAIEGGVLIIDNNRIVGAIGVSGGSSAEDAEIARAGIIYAQNAG